MASSYNELFGLGSHSADSRLAGWWLLNDNAANTTVLDLSGNARHGTLAGGNTAAAYDIGNPGNGWITECFFFAGLYHVTLPDTVDLTGADQTLCAWVKGNASADLKWFGQGDGLINGAAFDFTSEGGCRLRHGGGNITYGSLTRTDWNCIVANVPSSATTTDDITVRGNGSALTPSRTGGSNQTLAITSDGPTIGTAKGTGNYDARVANLSRFSPALTTSEQDEVYLGPEPVNSAAPAISGMETQGETLTATAGTWGLAAPFTGRTNGTITYAYQWTRSNDGSGTGESDISGATSNTYTLTTADIGKYIRCRVRASNNGGYDSSADTNSDMSGAIASGGGGTTVDATVGSVELAPLAASVSVGTTVAATTGSVQITTLSGSVSAGTTINATVGVIQASPLAASVTAGTSIAASVGSVQIAPLAASVDVSVTIDATVGALQLAPLPATVTAGTSITATTAAIHAVGLPATVSNGADIAANVGSVAVAPLTASVSAGTTVRAVLSTAVLRALAASVVATVSVNSTVGQLEFTPLAASVSITQTLPTSHNTWPDAADASGRTWTPDAANRTAEATVDKTRNLRG